MVRLINRHKGPLGLPGAGIIPHKGSIVIEDGAWLMLRRHSIVARWLSAGVIAVKEDAEDAAPSAAPVIEGAPTASDVLKMASDGTPFPTFKAAASKLLGDATPSTKVEIIEALEAFGKPAPANGWG
jgi:hypothetical protein